ncbi:MAG: protein-export chaperone SecB [Gemmatimonadetes bacterium]|jgi:preprotein translocase subunit SecB|nr:protein-export chaperone SecB [Gemmatimonadota bacterium]
MNELNEIPTSGFRLLRVVTIHQAYSIAIDEETILGVEDRRIAVDWDWSVSEDREFDVFLGVALSGSQEAPETVHAEIVGEFELEGTVPSMTFRKFVHTAAPAILLPYVRQIISDLTGRGPYGPYYLPSVNVVRMMQRYDFETTGGAKQLREDPELAKLYGWPTDVQLTLPSEQPQSSEQQT